MVTHINFETAKCRKYFPAVLSLVALLLPGMFPLSLSAQSPEAYRNFRKNVFRSISTPLMNHIGYEYLHGDTTTCKSYYLVAEFFLQEEGSGIDTLSFSSNLPEAAIAEVGKSLLTADINWKELLGQDIYKRILMPVIISTIRESCTPYQLKSRRLMAANAIPPGATNSRPLIEKDIVYLSLDEIIVYPTQHSVAGR